MKHNESWMLLGYFFVSNIFHPSFTTIPFLCFMFIARSIKNYPCLEYLVVAVVDSLIQSSVAASALLLRFFST
jgi:hypothetical protein